MASKYDRIPEFLNEQRKSPNTVRFGTIAQLVGGLPRSAYRHPAWWANEEAGQHIQARSWMRAGWAARDLDMSGQRVTFERRRT